MNLIDKDALVAEIERRIQESLYAGGATRGVYLSERMKEDSYILSFIDTFEAKEVDLDREIRRYRMRNPIIQHREESLYDYMANVAKHFFELGLKVNQKGE